MDPGDIYDALGDQVTVDRILESSQHLPDDISSLLSDALIEYSQDYVLPRDKFVDIMEQIIQVVSAGTKGPRVRHIVKMFEELNEDGLIRFSGLKHLFGEHADIMVEDESKTYTLGEFMDEFGDLFDEDGNLRELPPAILEQLKKVNRKIKSLHDDIQYKDANGEAMYQSIKDVKHQHTRDKQTILDMAAEVEEQRDTLYDELKSVKQQMRTLKNRPILELPGPPVSVPPPLPPPAMPPPLPERNSSTIDVDIAFFEELSDNEEEEAPPITYCDLEHDSDSDDTPHPEEVWACAEIPLEGYAWYKGDMNRPAAEAHLKDSHTGAFVVRKSSLGTTHALSIKTDAKILHYIIATVDDMVALQYVDDNMNMETVKPLHPTVPDLIHTFSTRRINNTTPILCEIHPS